MHTKRRQNNMGGGTGNNGGQHRHPNNRPRRFTNNRPQGGDGNDPANVARTRRNAVQSKEKYQMMARDAMSAGDRVLAEYYLQHADHYHRILLSLPPEEVRPQFQRNNHNSAANGEHSAQGDHAPAEGTENGAAENNAHAHNGAQHSANHDGDREHEAPVELPAFITQPTHTETPE